MQTFKIIGMILGVRRKPGCWKNHLRSWNCFQWRTSLNGTSAHGLALRMSAAGGRGTGHKALLMADIEDTERPYPRPLSGAKVRHLPSALVPARTALIGRYITLEPLDAGRHASDLFEASHGSEAALQIWDYLPWGPWKSEVEYRNVLRQQTARPEQIYYAIRPAPGGKAFGH